MSSMQTTPQQVQTYLRDTLNFFRAHLKTLAVLVLPYVVASELVNQFYVRQLDAGNRMVSGLMVEMILHPILQSVLILFLAAAIGGHQKSVKDCYQYSVQYWPRMLVLTILSTLGIMSGLSLFIVPGIYLMIRLTMADMFLVLENQNVVASLRSSFAATVPATWLIFLGLAMLFPGVTALSLGLSHISHSLGNPLTSLVISMVQAVLNTLYTIYLFRVFSAIRQTQS